MYWEGAHKKSWLIFYLLSWITNRYTDVHFIVLYTLIPVHMFHSKKKTPEPDLAGCLWNTWHQSGTWPTMVKKNTGDEFSQIPTCLLLENSYAASIFFF